MVILVLLALHQSSHLLFRVLIAETVRNYFAVELGLVCLLLKKKMSVIGEGDDEQEDDYFDILFETSVTAATDQEDFEHDDDEHGQFDRKGFEIGNCGGVHK